MFSVKLPPERADDSCSLCFILEEDASKYFQFIFNVDNATIYWKHVRAYDAVNVFGVPKLLTETMNALFDNYHLHHHSTALLEGIHLSFKKSARSCSS